MCWKLFGTTFSSDLEEAMTESGKSLSNSKNYCSVLEKISKIKKNTLADTMRRLIKIDPQMQQESEPEGYEFGYYSFDSLPAMEVTNINITQDTSVNVEDRDLHKLLHVPLSDKLVSQLQLQHAFCSHIITQIKKRKY